MERAGQPDGPAPDRPAGRRGRSGAGVGAVVLTHIPPWHDRDQVLAEATPHFAGPVSLAVTGAVWEIG